MVFGDAEGSFASPFDRLMAILRMTGWDPDKGSFGQKAVNGFTAGQRTQLGFRKADVCAKGQHDPLDADVLRSQDLLLP